MAILVFFGVLLLSPFVALLLYPSAPGRQKRLLYSGLLTLTGFLSCCVVVYVQTVLNSPDVGMEFQQLYLPTSIYLGLSALGGILCLKSAQPAR